MVKMQILVRNFVIWKVLYVFQSLIFFAFKRLMVVSEPNQFSLHGDFYSAQTITNSHVVSIVTQTKEQQRSYKTTLFF
jgi:hypothetical protein